ncbi:MAG TPA: DinB family protein [Blastocatellia bacterium]|nr:DinB family protein [Blastocatellia bacterium]
MIEMVTDLMLHKAYANAALMKAIRVNQSAARDPEFLKLLHHIIVANRFWLSVVRGQEFDVEKESKVPDSFDAVVSLYRKTHTQEAEWINTLHASDLERMVETSYLPGASLSVGQALMQVCMHSNGHRVQCATRLRTLGGTPPPMDFILWLSNRPAAEWS